MAETLTTRIGLRIYGAGTDTFGRVEYNDNMTALETYAAMDMQDTFANRPAAAAANRGMYYFATDSQVIYRSDGTNWYVVGSRILDEIATSSGTSTVPLTVKGITSQSANLFEAKVVNTLKASISKDGVYSGDSFTGKKYTASGGVATDVLFSGTAASSQSADVVSIVDNGASTLFKVSSAGGITSPYFKSAAPSTGGSAIGAASADTVANLTSFSGVPALQVYSGKGGAGTTFTDFLYLKHQAADTTAVLRRFGLLMRVGDEISGDVSKTASLYLESSAASFGAPKLVLGMGDAPVMQFPTSGNATVEKNIQVNGQTVLNPSGASSLLFGTTPDAEMGLQGSGSSASLYTRLGGSGAFYLFGGGVHSSTPGDAGSGGTVLGSVTVNTGLGQLNIGRVIASSFGQVGASNSVNTQIAGGSIQAYNNGVVAGLGINGSGGTITLGSATSTVAVPNALTIQGHRVYIQASAPSSGMSTGDIWLDI